MTDLMDSVSDKATRLFTYLKELSKLRTTHIKDISRYNATLWFSDIPEEKLCYCLAWDLWNEGEQRKDVWIEVRKPSLNSPPEVPDELEAWIREDELSDSSLEEPGLRDSVTLINEPDFETMEETTETLVLDDHPDIFELWLRYTDEKWKPWAEEDRRLQRVQQVYHDLYSIYQKSEKLGEQYEVIVGIGFLLWRSPRSGEIRHPLLSLKARLSFDSTRGIIHVLPSLEGPQPELEIDMLESEDRPIAKDEKSIQEMVDVLDGEPWDGPSLEAILKSLANGISTEGIFTRSTLKPAYISEKAQISFCPVLILRRRTRRSFVEFYGAIVDRISETGIVPKSARGLVSIVESERTSSKSNQNSQSSNRPPKATELYFPLPANDEQRQIIDKIRYSKGIVVQGPPGTGKSQTIANLIAHLLAIGKRILVTSETPRALDVLGNLLPKEIRELCVLWLGSGPEAQESLESSVQGITLRKANWDAIRTSCDIQWLESKLDSTRKNIAQCRTELIACRESDTFKHTNIFGLYSGTLESIAKNISRDRETYGWLLDRPDSGCESEVTSEELLELLTIDRQLSSSEIKSEISRTRIPSDQLPSPEHFKKLTVVEKEAFESYKNTEYKREYTGYELLRVLPEETRKLVLHLLIDLISRMEGFSKHIHCWVDRAAREIAAEQDRVWMHLLNSTDEHLNDLSEQSQHVSELRVTGLEDRDYYDVANHAEALIDHLESGKKLKYLGLFRPKSLRDCRYLIDDVRVDGAPCDSTERLTQLLQWIDYEKTLGKLDEMWQSCTDTPEGDYATRLAAYENLCEPLREVMQLPSIIARLKTALSECVGLSLPRWHVTEEIISLRDAVEAVGYEERLRIAASELSPLMELVSEAAKATDAHSTSKSIRDAVKNRDIISYKQNYKALLDLEKLSTMHKRSVDICGRFERVAPKTASEYKRTCYDDCWNDRFLLYDSARNWSLAEHWLAEMCSENRSAQLVDTLEQLEIDEKKLIGRLAAAKAWQHCMVSLGERERQALVAWMQAVRNIKGGTGRHAERHRQIARSKLAECRKAIPAWVMPLYQVVQTTSPEPGAFDYVIVDEASQSGPEALLLNYIGKKIIVVGDDKQIAPLHVGINRDNVTRLQEMYLKGIPHSELYGLESSLFSLSQLRFSNRVRLREHFRCMPEIIQFSNRMSYSAEPLIPLRQFGADRLKPCRTTHVKDGYRKGWAQSLVNEPEAKAIVNQIVECLENSEYEDKSFGVISLMGGGQSALIAKLLMQEIGADEIESRKLLCGSPYDFQGDERDVVFLSMVDAPPDGKMCRMVRDSETQRRYNVAASRAKDQLWLFHTPSLNDLRTECLRYRLLEHCLDPSLDEQSIVRNHNVDSLRRLAESEKRGHLNPPEPFDSWFEVDVFVRIAERGYRVIPQYEVANRRIDLYIRGLKCGLAVECHGDRWHGPDQYGKDLERQRQLERCGFNFKVVWGSQFYRDSRTALEPIWDELSRQKIYPEHRWEEERHKEESATEIPSEEELLGSDRSTREADDDYETHDPDLFPRDDADSKKSVPKAIPARLVQRAIVSALGKCPRNTCTKKSITRRVLKELGINTRGNPRLEFERRVKRNVMALSQKGIIEEYRAKNARLRLLKDG